MMIISPMVMMTILSANKMKVVTKAAVAYQRQRRGRRWEHGLID
ncbi:MAG: hypothetical protein ACXW4U_08660 [Anaerolineales bacterium]